MNINTISARYQNSHSSLLDPPLSHQDSLEPIGFLKIYLFFIEG